MKAIVVIPARVDSKRLPRKVLRYILDRPMLQYVYESCQKAELVSDVLIATDSEEVIKLVETFGGRAVLTSTEHPSGTDRIAEVAKDLSCEIVVNVQADEPLIRADMVDAVVRLLIEDPQTHIGTLAKEIDTPEEIFNPNTVKVVFSSNGYALYFSRYPLPFYREIVQTEYQENTVCFRMKKAAKVYKHIGIYSYRRDALLYLTGLPQSELEKAEKLEQLRALEAGLRIKVALSRYDTIGVDTEEDIKRVERILQQRGIKQT